MSKYVIIGNAIASTGCIEGIRKEDKKSEITLISGEDHPAYCRPLISYYLQGKTDLKRILYRPETFYDDMNVNVVYGAEAIAVDAEKKVVKLSNDKDIPYDKLCICTGSNPFAPPFEGLDSVRSRFSFITIDDSPGLEKAITADSRVLIVGAGLIGLKCAEGLKERVKEITVCDLATRVLPSIFDDTAAAIMQKHIENNGIHFLLGDTAVKFDVKKSLEAKYENKRKEHKLRRT